MDTGYTAVDNYVRTEDTTTLPDSSWIGVVTSKATPALNCNNFLDKVD